MAYTINKYNGESLTTVEDGTLDRTTELSLVGKNYAGYGETQNENLVHLMENFSGTSAPTKPITGMIWYDGATTKLKFWDGAQWKTTGGAEASATEPAGLNEGDFWWNNQTNQLYAKAGNGDVVLVGPQVAGTGLTQMRSLEVIGTDAASHAIIAATINDSIVFIISPDEFILSAEDAITGFDEIHKGITLVNTTIADIGVTNPLTEFYFWGTASNSEKLGGRGVNDFLTTDNLVFTNTVRFGDGGFTLGTDNDIDFKIDTDSTSPVLKLNNNMLRVRDADDAIAYEFTNISIAPGVQRTGSIGTDPAAGGKEWDAMFATNFRGLADEAQKVMIGAEEDGVFFFADINNTPSTIAARTDEGHLRAVIFDGIATQSQYADLAEKYTTQEDLEPGTPVAVSSSTDYEVAPAKASSLCIGVVSTDPGIMMNSNAQGQYIALAGRVPVKVKGPVLKGQAVYAWDEGICTTVQTTALVGIALETNKDDDIKLVECVLKV